MTTSLKQMEANRRNALKSTGPVTAEGKARSRCNAVRHGLTAETVIGDLEDSEDYQAFEEAVTADYDAQSAVERELVLRLASILWRLRRATSIETSLFAFAVTQPGETERSEADPISIAGLDGAKHDQWSFTRRAAPRPNSDTHRNTQQSIGDRFLRLMALPTFPLDRLSRYEQILWRQARQITFALDSSRRPAHRNSRFYFPFSFDASEK